MTAPTIAQVLELAANTASDRQARLNKLDAEWRRLAHPPTKKPAGVR